VWSGKSPVKLKQVLNLRSKFLGFYMSGWPVVPIHQIKRHGDGKKGNLLHGPGHAMVRGKVSTQPIFSHFQCTEWAIGLSRKRTEGWGRKVCIVIPISSPLRAESTNIRVTKAPHCQLLLCSVPDPHQKESESIHCLKPAVTMDSRNSRILQIDHPVMGSLRTRSNHHTETRLSLEVIWTFLNHLPEPELK
jgi:hypothetical protein